MSERSVDQIDYPIAWRCQSNRNSSPIEAAMLPRTLSVDALRDLGYTVHHASGGAEALNLLKTQPGVRLLFTGIVML